jgi:hypothetical protein
MYEGLFLSAGLFIIGYILNRQNAALSTQIANQTNTNTNVNADGNPYTRPPRFVPNNFWIVLNQKSNASNQILTTGTVVRYSGSTVFPAAITQVTQTDSGNDLAGIFEIYVAMTSSKAPNIGQSYTTYENETIFVNALKSGTVSVKYSWNYIKIANYDSFTKPIIDNLYNLGVSKTDIQIISGSFYIPYFFIFQSMGNGWGIYDDNDWNQQGDCQGDLNTPSVTWTYYISQLAASLWGIWEASNTAYLQIKATPIALKNGNITVGNIYSDGAKAWLCVTGFKATQYGTINPISLTFLTAPTDTNYKIGMTPTQFATALFSANNMGQEVTVAEDTKVHLRGEAIDSGLTITGVPKITTTGGQTTGNNSANIPS